MTACGRSSQRLHRGAAGCIDDGAMDDHSPSATLLAAVLCAACGSSTPAASNDAASPVDASDATSRADASDSATADVATTQAVRIDVRAVVGALPFACGTVFHDLGTTHTDWTPADFRFYVHDVRLVTAAGAEVAVALDEDGTWQHAGVALLDFEDGTGGCTGGTTATRARITGTAPVGTYQGLRLRIGVPFAQDHGDVSVAPSPLDVSGLFWSWAAGYKFLKIDGTSTGVPTGYNIHLGSTGCTADASGHVTSPCANPNVVDVDLPRFDPTTQAVVADLAALVAGANLDANAPGTPPGCMSALMDPDCAPLFSALGLPYGGAGPAGAQTFLTVR